MRIKTFVGKDMSEAMAHVRRDMGADAVILSSAKTRRGNVEVRAAVDRPHGDAPPPQALDSAGDFETVGPEPSREEVARACAAALLHHGLDAATVKALAEAAAKVEPRETVAGLARAMDARWSFQPLTATPERPLILFGAPGCGKTVGAAKLAARAAANDLESDLVSTDIDRGGGTAQLADYADALGAGFCEARGAKALARVAEARDTGRALIIDTPALDPFDPAARDAAIAFARATDAQPVGVIDAGMNPADAYDAAKTLKAIGCRRMLLTKCDLVRRAGAAFSAADAGLAFGALSSSPFVGRGLAPATPLRLARLTLDKAVAHQAHGAAA